MGDNMVERKEDEPSGMDQLDAYIAAAFILNIIIGIVVWLIV